LQLESLVYFLVIGAVAGWLASQMMRGGGFGVLGNIVIGVIGAVFGGWLFGVLGITAAGGLVGSLITAVVGAAVLLVIVGRIKRGRFGPCISLDPSRS
jgi:uncharacterized membrane protein YeaQ/YmgE (transglycosylase-associated protein family)